MSLFPAISALGSIFGRAGGGAARTRHNDNQSINQRNQLIAQLYGINQNALMNSRSLASNERTRHADVDLDRRRHQQDQRRFALQAPGVRASQSVRGSILANAQPFSVSGLPAHVAARVPQISGGLTPAMFSGDTRALGQELTRKALMNQLSGDSIDEFSPLESTDFDSAVMSQPALQQTQRPGLLENILGGLGLGLSAIGGAGEIYQGRRPRSHEPGDEDEDI